MPTDTEPRSGPSDVQPVPVPDKEMGITIDMPFGTFNDELPNPAEVEIPDLLLRISNMLRTDGHFRALARLLSLPFRQAKWSIVPDEDGEEEAQFIEAMLTRPPYQGGMTTSFDYVRALGARAFWQGFQVWEEVYTYATLPGFDREMLVLRKLAPRESRTVRFRADATGGFDGVTQRASDGRGGMREIKIPRDKVLFFTVDKEEHPFYGRSMFEPALYHFDKKHKLYYIAHIAAQITAVPGRVAKQEGGGATTLKPSEKTALRQALADFGFNSAMILPPGVSLEAFGQGTTSGVEGILSLINHHNIQASQSILAQFIDLGQQSGGSGGSFALSKDSSDLFLMCCQALLDSFGEMLTWHLFPKFIDWNFNSGKYPKIQFEPLADDTKAALMEVFSTIATASATQTTPDFIYELEKRVSDMLGLPVDYEAIDAEREAMAEQTQTVADALASLQGAGLGLDPTAAPPGPPAPDTVALSDPQDIFNAPDWDTVADDDFSGMVALAAAPATTAASERAKRDKIGQFARLNEVGTGAGEGSQATLGAVTTDIQTRLTDIGYDLGASGPAGDGVDGAFGAPTVEAVKKFQADAGLPVTGRVDLGTYAMLLEMSPKGPERAAKAKGQTKPAAAKKKAPAKKAAAKKKASSTPRNLAEAAAAARAVKNRSGSAGISED